MEIGKEASEQSILSAIREFGTFHPSGDKNTYEGNFNHSNMYFKVDISPQSKAVMAENVGELQNIEIGARIFFFVVPSQYEICINQIVEFMNVIARTTEAKFVLSQEYETVYAVKSNGGIDYKCSFYSSA
jgi:hypothetical protein